MIVQDKRYTITKEYAGYVPMMYVVRFFDGWLGTTKTYKEAELIAVNHALNRSK